MGGMMSSFRNAVLVVLVMSVAGIAQIVAGVQLGYAQSAYEDHDSKSGAFPLGITVGTDILPMIEVGGEFNMLLTPFVLDVEGMDDDFEATQNIIGVYGKYFFPMPTFSPYARLGIGYYTGSWEEGQWDGDFDSAVGFSIGAGAKTLMGIYGEFVYHIMSRKGDWEDAKTYGANNWGIHLGYQMEF
jgi:hypothetical protein